MKKGISLIALIILIIVLIILTTSVIWLASGENGIIERAQKAVEENNKSIITERVLIEMSNIKMDSVQVGQTVAEYLYNEEHGAERRNILASKGITTTNEKNTNSKIFFTVNNEYTVITDANGNILATEKIHELGDAVNSNRYGDIINYNVSLTPKGENTQEEGFLVDGEKWKIFYEDLDYIYIITGDYLHNSLVPNEEGELKMSIANKYSTYWSIPNGIKNQSGESIDVGKAEKFGFTWLRKYRSSTNENVRITADLFDNIWTEKFGNGIDGLTCSAIGGPTIEMFVKSWNSKGYLKIYCHNTTSFGYTMKANPGDSISHAKVLDDQEGYGNVLYFPHQEVIANSSGYWIASPTSSSHLNYVMYIKHNGYVTYGDPSSSDALRLFFGVRPVVAIPKDKVQLTSTVVNDKTVWNITRVN